MCRVWGSKTVAMSREHLGERDREGRPASNPTEVGLTCRRSPPSENQKTDIEWYLFFDLGGRGSKGCEKMCGAHFLCEQPRDARRSARDPHPQSIKKQISFDICFLILIFHVL